ncbi:MAG: hypothetical protein LBD35_03965 [Prevotellaceae bacterium]|jgi:phage shock protein A|nr:hypothetical protein [Prevotellaceae bacterium]
MDREIEIVGVLKGKIKQLIELHEGEKRKVAELRKQKETLRERISAMEAEIKELKLKNHKLTIATSFKSVGGSAQEAKKKISKIVREIDDCMALLNR